jgi:hypothetical protein
MLSLSLSLPKYEVAINRLQDEVYYGFHMLDEILKLFPPMEVIHRGTTRLVSKPSILDRSPRLHKTNFTIDPNMFLQTDVEKFAEVLFQLTTSLQIQQKIHTIEIMFDTSDAVGNTADAKGRNFWEVYIEALEKLDYRFIPHKFYANAETIKKATAVPPTEDQIRRAKEVIKAKREEYLAKKRTRRLA